MLALVTGAGGRIGRYLLPHLLAQGIEVRAFVRANAELPTHKRLQVARGDVRDPEAVLQAARDCTWIYHLAAIVHGQDATPANLWAVNVEGTRNVARAALTAGAQRLVYTSSVAAYGRLVAQHGITEETPLHPDSPYGESKVASEKMLAEFADLPVTIVRTVTVWGPGNDAWAGLFRSVASGRFRLMGSGRGMHTLTHIEDLNAGLWLCATTPSAARQTYLLAGNDAVPLRTLIALMAEEAGAPPVRDSLPEAPLLVYRALDQAVYRFSGRRVPKADRLDFFLGDRTFDIAKAQRDLGFEPRFTTREIVRSAAEYLRSVGALDGVG